MKASKAYTQSQQRQHQLSPSRRSNTEPRRD